MQISQYTEKSIVVRIDVETEACTKKMIDLGGKYNEFLKGGSGWIFPNFKKQYIEAYVTENNLIIINPVIPPKQYSSNKDNSLANMNYDIMVSTERKTNGYNSSVCNCNCADKINKLEAMMLELSNSIKSVKKEVYNINKNNISSDDTKLADYSDGDDSSENVPHVRLLNKYNR